MSHQLPIVPSTRVTNANQQEQELAGVLNQLGMSAQFNGNGTVTIVDFYGTTILLQRFRERKRAMFCRAGYGSPGKPFADLASLMRFVLSELRYMGFDREDDTPGRIDHDRVKIYTSPDSDMLSTIYFA